MKTQLNSAFVLFLLAITAADTTTAEVRDPSSAPAHVAYFSQMVFRESPISDLRGAYPISSEQARAYKHYRFTYDHAGRVIEVAFRHGDQIQELNISRNALIFTPVIQIEYRGNTETRQFYDRFMNPANSNGAFREIYDLDQDGNRVALHFHDFYGHPIDNEWSISRYEWEIDGWGVVTENRFNLAGEPVSIRPDFPFYCLKLYYDPRSFLATMENHGKRCAGLTDNALNAAQDRLQYNAQGGFYAWNVYNARQERSIGNGPRVARGLIVRDRLGHSIGEYYQDTGGQMMTNAYGWTDTKAEFDDHGNMIKRYNLGIDGKPVNNPITGYCGYNIKFDEKGIYRRLLKYFDETGAAATHAERGYHAVKTDHNDVGNVIGLTYFDQFGSPVNRTDNCVARIENSFDAKNRIVRTRRFNAAGEAVTSCHGSAENIWHETQYFYIENGPLSHSVQQ